VKSALVISSFVAKGSVGLQATLPALSRAGVDVIAVPTIVLSNHPGFKACAGTPVAIDALDAIIDALDANGWLRTIDAVFTGYLPSLEHVAFARRTVVRVRSANPATLYLADPVLGDDPTGLYIAHAAAEGMRDTLLPLADVVTPNRFELAWLTDRSVTDRDTAVAASRSLGAPLTTATSIPGSPDTLSNVLVMAEAVWTETVSHLPGAPHGTGDYFAGALLAQRLSGAPWPNALAIATRQTETLLLASQGRSDLVFAGR